jgi:DNA invertase Pin-like site-specific DNA recombinase
MIHERVFAGLARAKEQGVRLGRRRLEISDATKVTAIKAALAAKKGVRRIAGDLRTGVGTVLRIKEELGSLGWDEVLHRTAIRQDPSRS